MNVIARLNNNELVSIKMVHTQTVEKFLKKKQTNRNSFIAFRVFHPPSLPCWPVHSCAPHGPDVINIHSDGASEGGGGVCRSGISDTLSIATEGGRVGNLVSGSCWMHNP